MEIYAGEILLGVVVRDDRSRVFSGIGPGCYMVLSLAPKSLSVVGAPLRVSPPSLRGLDCAFSQRGRALLATCSSPLRSIWAGVESSRDARGENQVFSALVLSSLSLSLSLIIIIFGYNTLVTEGLPWLLLMSNKKQP